MTKRRVTRKSKKPAEMTVREFKTWMEGVKSMQPEDWCPSPEQWAMISAQIEQIVEPEPVVQPVAAPAVPVNPANPAAHGHVLAQAAGNPAGQAAQPVASPQRLNLPSANASTGKTAPSTLQTNPALKPAKVAGGDGMDLSGEGANTGLMTVDAVTSEDGSYKSSFT